ncbi:hypothetical protein JCM11641_002610 [Rhodosporidiobolus odoratus]
MRFFAALLCTSASMTPLVGAVSLADAATTTSVVARIPFNARSTASSTSSSTSSTSTSTIPMSTSTRMVRVPFKDRTSSSTASSTSTQTGRIPFKDRTSSATPATSSPTLFTANETMHPFEACPDLTGYYGPLEKALLAPWTHVSASFAAKHGGLNALCDQQVEIIAPRALNFTVTGICPDEQCKEDGLAWSVKLTLAGGFGGQAQFRLPDLKA